VPFLARKDSGLKISFLPTDLTDIATALVYP
jgi:hypothetical protein